ncbi:MULTISPECIES: hypothetical protein [unclassified Streptomyces]|uniref:hypothetical protein n=1 Tax=unclassified Streptomyces TaxID=2593676 RepID=UPI000DC76050|nr:MULTISPECIES: hypothetical protein [unclassified Streptomyces]AWZ07124.1 hypothetical protein DRB89_23670 [Streptomyces sp. ICC4]AWZ14855.1 hypothetical protein DRB96_24250 [Streptomyces sp. ICC1]
MAPDKLLQRLEWEQRVAREKLDAIRERLVALEERAAALAITRRMLTDLLGAESGAGEPPTEFTSEGAQEPSTGPQREERVAPPMPPGKPKGPVSRRIVTLVASADRPMRAREVTIALGRKDPTRSQVEATRRACRKLAGSGFLKALASGEFTGPEGAA